MISSLDEQWVKDIKGENMKTTIKGEHKKALESFLKEEIKEETVP